MRRWGYAPTVETLAAELLEGAVDPVGLGSSVAADGRFALRDGFVCLRGDEALIEKSRDRVAANRRTNGSGKAIARKFASELLRICPVVDCIALSGSVASGGYAPEDDIDLDIFVHDGAKYLTYAVALALGLRTSIRHRSGTRLRKIICVNVLWTQGQSLPFGRTDESLAFELLHCRPIYGGAHFSAVLRANGWIDSYFPQVAQRVHEDPVIPRPGGLGRLIGWVASHPALLRRADRLGRAASFAVYTAAHWLKRNDPVAMERLVFLRHAKYPYEVFQD